MNTDKLVESYLIAIEKNPNSAVTTKEFRHYVNTNLKYIREIKNKGSQNFALQKLEERLKSFNIDLGSNGKKVKFKDDLKFVCPNCDSENVEFNQNLSSVICNDCAITSYLSNCALVGSDEDISYATYTYKRINHFLEWIIPFCSKTSPYIPVPVMNTIRLKVVNRSVDDIKRVLKDPKLKIYKEYYIDIYCVINKKKKPFLKPELREKLEKMFNDIQIPFTEVCPKSRKNFLSYPYVVYKLLQILGLKQFLPFITLLKSKSKINSQEKIFKDICKKLDWTFVPI